MPTSMRASCFSRCERLQHVLARGGALLRERDADVVLAGRHDDARLEAAVDLVGRLAGEHLRRHLVVGAAEARQREPRAVEADLEVVRRLRAAHDVDGVAPEPRLDDVLAVDGEVVAHEHAAARAERQPVDVIASASGRAARDTS